MSDDPVTSVSDDAGVEPYPSPLIYKPEVFVSAVTEFVANVLSNVDDPDLQQQAEKIRGLMPIVALDRLLMVEIPAPTDQDERGNNMWEVGDGVVFTDDPAQLPVEIRIKGFPHPVRDPRRMAVALLAADAA